jgi:hypothetical protein
MANTGIYETVFKAIRFADWNRKNPFTPKANGRITDFLRQKLM